MKKITKKSLDELAATMPVLSEEAQRLCVGGGTVRVTVDRILRGSDSTLSRFIAVAYDDNGQEIDAISGVFLEPMVDYSRAQISGSDTAIEAGTYQVVPSTFRGRSGYFELENVPGRSGIKIHAGNTGRHTEGCFLPGESGFYNSTTKSPEVRGSLTKLGELSSFFTCYGSDGVIMEINNKFE